ncbi:MAG: orotidine-5'-phosphate decarboxylase [Candidatus Paceibacterota bacterium]
MQKILTPAERLIVAADFKPGQPWEKFYGRVGVRSQVLALANSLKGTGVYLKVNSALRACGYDLISEIQSCGLRVFADLKLYDIGETLSTDGILLKEAKPELLTTVCSAGVLAMQALKKELPDTEVLGVTVLTSLNGADVQKIYSSDIGATVLMLAKHALVAGIDGWICSPKEASTLRTLSDRMSINTPGIRPTWAIVPGDDQNPERIMTPAKAIKAGADRIVIGRPIVKAEKPYDAVMRTIDEIASAVT